MVDACIAMAMSRQDLHHVIGMGDQHTRSPGPKAPGALFFLLGPR